MASVFDENVKGVGVWGDTISATVYATNGHGTPVDVRWLEDLAKHPFIAQRIEEIKKYIAERVEIDLHQGHTGPCRD